jgi:hypothetical protein
MIRSAGFTVAAHPEEEVFMCVPGTPAVAVDEELPWLKR